ncbi:cytochrome c biogenesis protein CcdA [Pseudoalteromonas sp. MMG022]|uniref:cytochrome c biogenesis protein CcdA n=1 Tax=Pseudoalteromonas sp. MMG022 TaxID=2909978 RepID=UPI001F42B83C|nr:cytochrome c biogenesis protein CcdA [Pseudoalteromonas sp. MMG022]MCF6437427.1 sulfite exporter TauE/SafE family protein [Pseudoalteromonas sp. MMG022]
MGEFNTYLLTLLTSPSLHWWLILAAFGAGVLASLSPCIYPLLPITVAMLAPKAGNQVRAVQNAALYCLGFALLYALLGLLAAQTGQLFGQVASNPWLLIGFANLLLYMAAIMKGWLTLPSLFIFNSARSRNPLLMGATSGLVAAPCTSPVLMGLLVLVANQQHVWLGGMLLFFFALGMSSLLFLAGTFSQLLARLPKSGPWLSIAPNIFALLLFVMAQFYLIKAGQNLFF